MIRIRVKGDIEINLDDAEFVADETWEPYAVLRARILELADELGLTEAEATKRFLHQDE